MNPTLRIHTHWQVAQSSRTSQNLPKSMAAQPHGRKESTGIQHCIKAIAGIVVNLRLVQLITFGSNRTDNRLEIRYCSYT